MGINAQAKGKEGERQVARALNEVVGKVLQAQQWPDDMVKAAEKCIQRNQNQSAVGGSDLSNVFGLAVEVKRQETLSLEAWWRQCVDSAMRNKEIPVLVYRQNNKAWNVVMYLQNPLPVVQGVQGVAPYASLTVRAQMPWDEFLSWFEQWVHRKLLAGEVPRV
jgi:hypothetical protein